MKRFHDPMMPEEAGNIKNCPAVRDILTQGIVIPAWTWIKFNQTKDGLIAPPINNSVTLVFSI